MSSACNSMLLALLAQVLSGNINCNICKLGHFADHTLPKGVVILLRHLNRFLLMH